MDPELASPSRRLGAVHAFSAASLFLLLTVVCTWPMARDFRDHVQDAGDPFLEVAALTWASHALITADAPVLDAPQFYPYANTQLYQNSFFGQVPIFGPLWLATGNPVLAFQLSVLTALWLSSMGMWAYVRRLTQDHFAGLLAGALFAFHHYRFRNLQHLQVMSIWWWPLALWAMESFLKTRSWKAAIAVCVLAAAQVYSSVYMGAMLLLILLVRAGVEWIAEPQLRLNRELWTRTGGVVLLGAVLLLPLALPYVQVVRAFPAGHDLETVTAFSAAPRDYLRLGLSSVPYYLVRARALWEYTFDQFVLFPGIVTVVFALYGWLSVERSAITQGRPGAPTRRVAWALVVLSTVAVVLSLGPYLKTQGRATDIPLPALLLYEYVPGYTIFRVNTRFAFVLLFALSIGAGMGFAAYAKRREWPVETRAKRFLVCLALVLFENWNAPVPSEPVPVGAGLPRVYYALASEPDGGPIVHFPIGEDLYEEIGYVYGGLIHKRRLVNGYSTFQPPGYTQFRELAESGPSDALWAALAAWDVNTIVVHFDSMSMTEALLWRYAGLRGPVAVSDRFKGTQVWSLHVEPAMAERVDLVVELPASVSAGEMIEAVVRFTVPPGRVWRCPEPLGLRTVEATWQSVQSGPVIPREVRLLYPLFVVGGTPVETTVAIEAPPQTGTYTLQLSSDVGGGSGTTFVRPVSEASAN